MSTESTVVRGRRRDVELTQRILDETLRIVAERGYSGLRIEQVAAAVGCSKTAVYRRWPSRAELVVAAMTDRVEMGVFDPSGDVAADLAEHVWRHVRNQASMTIGSHVVTGVLAVTTDPQVRDLYWERFTSHRREMGRDIIRAGVEAGQLPPDVDADALLDCFAGWVFYRGAIRVQQILREHVAELVRAMIADPPRLRAAR